MPAVVLAGLLVLPGPAHASPTSTIPFTASFEGYADGATVIGGNGWYAMSNMFATVSNTVYKEEGFQFYPLTNATHTNILVVDSSGHIVSNIFHETADRTNVYVDMMVQLEEHEEIPPVLLVSNDLQVGVFLSTNGKLAILHSDWLGGADYTNRVTTLYDNPGSINKSGEWIRLTMTLDYLNNSEEEEWKFFKLQVNGAEPFTNEMAFTDPSATEGGASGGPWFLCANQLSANDSLASFSLSGNGYADDIHISSTNPLTTPIWTVESSADSGGSIDPYGKQFVYDGEDSPVFAISNLYGYVVTNVLINKITSIGVTNSYEFTNVQQHCWIEVQTDTGLVELVVDSGGYGVPDPADTNYYNPDSAVTCTMGGSPIDMGGRTQRVCLGWTGTGSLASNPTGGTNTGPFNITTNSLITWVWDLQYRLTVTNGTGSGWYDTNSAAEAEFEPPEQWATFAGWEGDVSPANTNDNPVTNTMDQARTITANYNPPAEYTAKGTKVSWLAGQSCLINYATPELAEEADQDLDGKKAWEEFFTGTEECDSNSVFKVLDVLYQGGSNLVTFYGTTNTGVTNAFGMERSTNLLVDVWTLIVNDLLRDPTGTNEWWDNTAASNLPSFYRPYYTNAP